MRALDKLEERIEALSQRDTPIHNEAVKKLKTIRTRIKSLITKGEEDKIPATVARALKKELDATPLLKEAVEKAKSTKDKEKAIADRAISAACRHTLSVVNLICKNA